CGIRRGLNRVSEKAIKVDGGQAPPLHTARTSALKIPFKEAFLVALAAGLGYGFDSYAVNIYGMLGPMLARDLNVTAKASGLIGSIFVVGYTIGTIGAGFLADRFGRRSVLTWSIILYGLTTSLGGLSSNLYVFTFLRFLTGLGGAAELAVGAPYTAEMWPKR